MRLVIVFKAYKQEEKKVTDLVIGISCYMLSLLVLKTCYILF